MPPKLIEDKPTVVVTKAAPAIFSVPCKKEDKEYLLNEALRTGLSQKELVHKAIEALKKGPKIPNALPIKL